MRYLFAALLLALTLATASPWPPGPAPAPCNVTGDPPQPSYNISIGDNPQWLPCPGDTPQPPAVQPTATRVPAPTPVYPYTIVLVPVSR